MAEFRTYAQIVADEERAKRQPAAPPDAGRIPATDGNVMDTLTRSIGNFGPSLPSAPVASSGNVMEALDRSIGNFGPLPENSPVRQAIPETAPSAPRTYAQIRAADSDKRLGQSAALAADINPAVAARILDAEKKSGLPRGYVEQNLDEVERMVALKSFDPMHFRAKSPKFAAYLGGDAHALAVAKKDLSQMGAIETAVALMEAGSENANPRLLKLWEKELDGQRLTAQETVDLAVLKRRQQAAGQAIDRAGPIPWALAQGAYAWRQAAETVPGQVGGALGGMGVALMATGGVVAAPVLAAGALVGGLAVGAVQAFNMERASAWGEFSEATDVNGKPIEDKALVRTAANVYGALSSVIETGSDAVMGGIAVKLTPGLNALKQKLGVGAAKVALKQATLEMLKHPTKRAVFAKMATGVAGVMATEWVEEASQTLLQTAIGEQMEARSGQTFAPTDWAKAREEAVKAGNAAAVGTAFIAGPAGAIGMRAGLRKVERTQQEQVFFKTLSDTMSQSDMVKNAPDVAESAVAAMTADTGVKNVYVPVAAWDAMFQADARGAAQQILGDTTQYDEAKSLTGADLVIPIEKYAARVAGTPLHAKLTPDLRLEQGGLSAKEAANVEANYAELMKFHAEAAQMVAEANAPLEQIRKAEYDMVRPFMGEREATRHAELVALKYGTRANRMAGEVDVFELWKAESANIKRDFGGTLGPDAIASQSNFAEMMRDSRLTTTGQVWAQPGDELSFYHGGSPDITSFRPRQAGAYFLSPSPETASEFASRWGDRNKTEAGAVYKVYATARKPFDYENAAHVDDIAQALEGVSDRDIEAVSAAKALHRFYTSKEQLIEGIRNGAWGAIEHPAVQKIIKAKRYDAFWVMEEGVKNLGMYDPKMTKSATGNRGTYDTTKDNILYQAARINMGPQLFPHVIEHLNLSEAEVAATMMEYMTGLPGTQIYFTPEAGGKAEIVQFLHERRLRSGLPVLDIKNEADRITLSRLMAAEMLAVMDSQGDALEWYDENIQQMLSLLELKHPEIRTDPAARMIFTLALAISSQNQNVESNLKYAEEQYGARKARGAFPEAGKGKAATQMAGNFKLANELLARFTPSELEQFLATPFTVKELTQAGFNIADEMMDETVLGSSVFGPKIGFGFYSNLMGNFDPITMDMWFMRTEGRLAGTLPKYTEARYNKSLADLRASLSERGRKAEGLFASQFDQDLVRLARTDEHAAVRLAEAIASAHERDYRKNRAAFDAKTRRKSRLVLDATKLVELIADPKDAPGSGSERQNLRDVVRRAALLVEGAYGKRVPPAALQALIWYPEQELYLSLGAKLRVTSQNYAGATEKLLLSEGYDGTQLNATRRSVVEPGAGQVRDVAGEPNASGDESAGRKFARPVPFTGPEKTRFLRKRIAEVLDAKHAGAARIMFEVAPDPDNLSLTDRWRKLDLKLQQRISMNIADEFIPKVLALLKASGVMLDQVGSYEADTNASFAFLVDKGDVGAVARVLGFVLSQKSMMAIGTSPFAGSFESDALSISVGEKSFDELAAIYDALHAIEIDGNRPIMGQSTSGGHMTVLLPEGVDLAVLSPLVDQALGGAYNFNPVTVHAAFPEAKDYDYAADGPAIDTGRSKGTPRAGVRSLRDEASAALEDAIQRASNPGGELLFQRDEAPAGAVDRLFQPAYHGSPHQFDEFSLDKIGTGEGAQAYGWGLYFAENPEIADGYRRTLSRGSPKQLEEKLGVDFVDANALWEVAAVAVGARTATLSPDHLLQARSSNMRKWSAEDRKVIIDKAVAIYKGAEGALYQVDIPDEAVARMLDWDKPLSEQSKEVFEAFDKVALLRRNRPDGDPTGDKLYATIVRLARDGAEPLPGQAEAFERGELRLPAPPEELASKYLASIGIPGIKYLDASSRTAGDGTRNLVVFDDKLVTITHKDGSPVTKAERDAFLQKQGPETRSTIRGQFERARAAGQRPLITLFKSANPSTILHELGHSWLEELRRDAEGPHSTPQLKADWEFIKSWSGMQDLPPGAAIPRASHELFARNVEAYFRTGQAPSIELRGVFSQFAAWLVKIYRSVRDLIGEDEIHPEFRKVMDRLLATDEQIAAAQADAGYETTALPTDELTAAEATEYQKKVAEVRLEAEERVRAEAMNEVVRERTDWWRAEKALVTREVEAEVNARPEYNVASWLRTGRLLDGSEVEGLQHARLDRQAIVYQYGEAMLPKLAFMLQAQGGHHPDVVAQAFGYDTGDAMLRAITEAQPRRQVISAEVDRRMMETHGDMLNDGGLAEKAIEAVHSDKQADVLLTELRILKRMGAKGDLTTLKAVQALAAQVVSRKMVGDLKPGRYISTGAKAGYEAEKAMIGKDYTHAFDSKLQQLMNLAMTQEIVKRKAEVDKAMRAWKQLDRSDERLSKSRDMNLVNTARAILGNYGLGKKTEKADAYFELVEEYDPATYADMVEMVRLAAAEEKPYTILTVDEFAQVKEVVDGLWTLSRTSKTVTIDGQRIDRNAIKAQLAATVAALGNAPNQRGVKQSLTKMEKFKVTLLDWRAALSRVEHWVDLMDGGKPGAFRKYIWQPVSEAADRYRDARKGVMERYLALTEQYLSSPANPITSDPIDANLPGEIDYVFRNGKAELLGALLHIGNLSNLAKLLIGGRGENQAWGEFNADGTLNTEKWDKFIKRMQDTGILTKADYDFIQSVWNLMESLKPAAQTAHREMYGHYFDEVTANAFSTPWGQYKGGYAPAVTDPNLVTAAAERADEAALRPQMTFMFPTTGRGFTKSRIENYRKPLQLNLGLVPQHIDKVLRFTHIEPRVREVSRIAMDKEFRANVASFVDTEVVTEMLVPWLERAAQQQVETPAVSRGMRRLDNVFRELRTRTGMQIMVGNVSNALQQITGLSSALLEVKPKYLRGALAAYIGSPSEVANEIAAKSTFMRNRTTASVIEVQQEIDNIMLDPSKYEKVRAFATRHGYFLQQGAQNVVDIITWRGAYNEAIAGKLLEREAVRRADAAVRKTQGSFAAEDMSRFETGGATFRLFTMFYSYFNLQANLLGGKFAQAMRDGGFSAPGRLFYIYIFGVMIPAALAEGIAQAMSGDLWDDDDDDGYLDNFLSVMFMGQFKFAAATVPFVGQAAQSLVNRFNDKPYDDKLSVSPALSILDAFIGTPISVYKATFDDGSWKKAIKDTLTLVGITTGLPLGVLARPLGYAADVQQGRVEPANAADYVRGLISGRGPQ